MKKLLTSLAAFFFIFSTSFAVMPNIVDFTGGLSTGIPFYGNETFKEPLSEIQNPNRILIGTFSNVNINPSKYVTFFAGAELLSDFCWNSEINSTILNVDFPLGLKIYPGLGGLNFGLAYTLGFNSMMYKDSAGDKHNLISPWGNGFKLFFEYDFSRITKSKYIPGLGSSWSLMPRGNYSYDNILTFYIIEHF